MSIDVTWIARLFDELADGSSVVADLFPKPTDLVWCAGCGEMVKEVSGCQLCNAGVCADCKDRLDACWYCGGVVSGGE